MPPYILGTNIGTTKRIAPVFGSLSGEPTTCRVLDGPPVRFVACATEDAVGRADDAIEALPGDGDAGALALLTTRHRHPVQQESVAGGRWQEYWADFFAGTDVFYGHVLGFKGSTWPAVVPAVGVFTQPERARDLLYVRLSRGRTQLVVCGDLDEIAAVGGEGVRRRLASAEQRDPSVG